MQEKEAQRLLEKFRAGECAQEEKIRLRNWFHTLNNEQPTGLTQEEVEDAGDEMWGRPQHPDQSQARPELLA